jgi:hypothetical protein
MFNAKCKTKGGTWMIIATTCGSIEAAMRDLERNVRRRNIVDAAIVDDQGRPVATWAEIMRYLR